MTLPVNDISPEARRLVVSTLSDPRALTEMAEVAWRSGESWRPIARISIKFFMETSEGKKAASLSAMGAAVYGAISDIASIIDEPASISPLDLDGYRRARFDQLVAMPKDDLYDIAEEAVVDFGINTPTLREAVDGIASNVVDKPRDRRLVLVGSALMRRYHLVYLADQQGSTDQASILDI